tara:strand:+ start:13721 stop:13909 length:189 start_codon:yes stop_codon:yes gene_type:complete
MKKPTEIDLLIFISINLFFLILIGVDRFMLFYFPILSLRMMFEVFSEARQSFKELKNRMHKW